MAHARASVFRLIGAVGVAATVALATACGSVGGGSGPTGSNGLPKTIKLLALHDESGLGKVAAHYQDRGMQLAIDEVNNQNFLGGSTLSVSVKDTTFDPQVAASQLSQAAADPSVVAVHGPLNSGEAAAMAPIANKAGLPTLVQTGGEGIPTGENVYQNAPSFDSYFKLGLQYLQSKQVKTVGVIYANDSQVDADVANKIVAPGAAKYGYRVVSRSGVPSKTTDFTAPISKILEQKPDAVVLATFAAPLASIVKTLRSGGFTGEVLGINSACCGALTPAGRSGVGMVWPTNFSAASTSPEASKFTKAYQKAYKGEAPAQWSAESYDGVWLLARAIKASGDASRAGIRKGMQMLAKTGFVGAEGKITFDGNRFSVPGVLVRWNGTREEQLATS